MNLKSEAVSPDRFDAVLFDLDGVITDTAKLHASCWKKVFDAFLKKRADEKGAPLKPFDLEDPTTKNTWTASRATTGFKAFLTHGVSTCLMVTLKTPRTKKRFAVWEISKMSCSKKT